MMLSVGLITVVYLPENCCKLNLHHQTAPKSRHRFARMQNGDRFDSHRKLIIWYFMPLRVNSDDKIVNQLKSLKFWNCLWYICSQKEICIQHPAMSQDFSGQNVRGRSFKGQNLEGANFSYADIRSADFTGANLRNANFSHATAGLQSRWAIFLVGVSLAQQMLLESKTEFLIEEMQPNLLFTANYKATYRVGLGLMVGLILGLSAGMYGLFLYSLRGVNLMMEEYGVSLSIPGVVMPGLVSGLVSGITAGLLSALVDRRIFGVICGLVAGLITGLLVILINVNGQNTIRGLLIILPSIAVFSASSFRLISPTIETVDAIEFSWFKAQKNLVIWLVVASIYIAVAVNFLHKFYSPQYLLSVFIIFIVIGVFLGGLQKKIEVDTRTIPNQGIKKAAAYSRLFFATFASISGVISWLIDSATFPAVIYIGLTFGLLSGLMLGQGSGVVCIQHFTLRLILYFNGYIPWNYARFLDYCNELLFLQRVGGRYRFIHKLLQDHFAKMDFKRN